MKTILVDAWNTLFTEEGVNKEMQGILDSFKNKKIVVTNANDEQITEFGIDKSPYEVFTLKHNPDKVDPVYFEKLLEKFNLKSEDVIYFEHNLEAVKSAESVGVNSYHYNHEEKDLKKLKNFLESNL